MFGFRDFSPVAKGQDMLVVSSLQALMENDVQRCVQPIYKKTKKYLEFSNLFRNFATKKNV